MAVSRLALLSGPLASCSAAAFTGWRARPPFFVGFAPRSAPPSRPSSARAPNMEPAVISPFELLMLCASVELTVVEAERTMRWLRPRDECHTRDTPASRTSIEMRAATLREHMRV